MNEWINNLKVGDKVVVACWTGRAIGTVDAINKATIKVNGTLYNKENGRERGGDRWSSSSIYEATPEQITSITLVTDRYRLSQKLQHFDCGQLTREQVDKFNNFLKTEFNR